MSLRSAAGTPVRCAWDWLARAHPEPGHARALLRTYGRAALQTGVLWDVVQVREGTGLRVLAEGAVSGPAFRDVRRGAVKFLVPVDGEWRVRGTACLADSAMVCVPAPDIGAPAPSPERPRVEEPPPLYWLTPPDGSGRLTDRAALRTGLASAPEPDIDHPWCARCGLPLPTPSARGDVPVHDVCAPGAWADGGAG